MTCWADDATGPLRSVVELVTRMEAALVQGRVTLGAAFADELVSVTTQLLDELDLDPRHELERDAELISTLRVYRNAAFVFRRLADAMGEPDPEMETLCATLIHQGHDHLQAIMGHTPELE